MHQILTRLDRHRLLRALIVSVALLTVPGSGRAQQSNSARAQVLAGVLEYRVTWLGDSTPIDACSIVSQVGKEEANKIAATFKLFAQPPASCETQNFGETFRNLFAIDTMAIDGRTAKVQATVRRGNGHYVHHEWYTLLEIPLPQNEFRWEVSEVRMSGAMTVVPVRIPDRDRRSPR